MNFPLCGGGKQLTSRLCFTASQLLARSTSKIAVEVENNLASQLENKDIKPRQHPGIVKIGLIELPTHLSRALQRVIGDHPIKTLLRDGQQLNKLIETRHPPPEQTDLKERMRKIVEEIDAKMSPEQLLALSEDEHLKWQRKREYTIRRRIAERTYAWKPMVYGPYESLVYAIARGAQEYSVLLHILKELQLRDSSFEPRSYFDFGAGIGTGMWAASNIWADGIFEYYNVDSSRDMNDLSEMLLRGGNENQQMNLRNVYYRQFLPSLDTKYDLVISAYSLFELPNAQSRQQAILNLWRKCAGYLVIVEEGTRRGFELVNEARDFVLSLDEADLKGHVLAPCPHDSPCPRLTNIMDRTPCNFEVRYVPLAVGDTGGRNPTARYSYIVLGKGSAINDETRKWPRLVRPTLVRSKHTICRMCTSDAKLQEVIFTQSKHGKPAYQCARVSRWGDRLPIAVGEPMQKDSNAEKVQETKAVDATETER